MIRRDPFKTMDRVGPASPYRSPDDRRFIEPEDKFEIHAWLKANMASHRLEAIYDYMEGHVTLYMEVNGQPRAVGYRLKAMYVRGPHWRWAMARGIRDMRRYVREAP